MRPAPELQTPARVVFGVECRNGALVPMGVNFKRNCEKPRFSRNCKSVSGCGGRGLAKGRKCPFTGKRGRGML